MWTSYFGVGRLYCLEIETVLVRQSRQELTQLWREAQVVLGTLPFKLIGWDKSSHGITHAPLKAPLMANYKILSSTGTES